MSGILKKNYKRPESAVDQSVSSMHFWGVCCESGKQYAQVVGQRFRITMAVLDPNSFQNDAREKTVSLIVIRGGIEYLLCVLKHGEIHQVSLNLIFDKGENVKFYINGHGKVYLSGYQLTDSEGDVMNDENGYLCPLVEVKSKRRKSNMDGICRSSSDITFEPKSGSKVMPGKNEKLARPLWTSLLSGDEDDDDDESDKDFAVNDEEGVTESDEEDSSDEEEELDEECVNEKEEEKARKQVFQNSHESRKRRKQDTTFPQKRTRTNSSTTTSYSSFVENSEDVICIKDGKNTSFNKNTSVGHTPMPKKEIKQENVSSEKKPKKEKRLSEISNVSEKSNKEHQSESPTAASTPKRRNPVMKLEGGVEIQDVITGRGPVATNGKMLHVFFVGRLSDKTIFDSRLPGKKPFSFKLGAHQVIKGWDVGLLGMQVGGKRKLKVPPDMAYGKLERDGIPPHSTLFFVVELQSVS